MLSARSFLVFVFFCNCIFVYGDLDMEWSTRADAQKLKQLKKSTRVTKTPCSCNSDSATCVCCASFAGEKGCASFKIADVRSRNQMVRYNFNFNDQTTSMMAPAGVNPPPLCITVLGGWISHACASFDVSIVNRQYFQACVRVRATLALASTLEANLECAELFIGYHNNYIDDLDDGAGAEFRATNEHLRLERKKHTHPCNK